MCALLSCSPQHCCSPLEFLLHLRYYYLYIFCEMGFERLAPTTREAFTMQYTLYIILKMYMKIKNFNPVFARMKSYPKVLRGPYKAFIFHIYMKYRYLFGFLP
jgi:hypothetical protein